MSEQDDQALDTMLSGAAKLEAPQVGEHVEDGALLDHQRGRLPAEASEAIDRHLATCAECRALALELARPLDELTRARARRSLRRPQRGWMISAAALLLVLSGGAAWLVSGREAPLEHYAVVGPLGGIEALRGEGGDSRIFDANGTVRFLIRPDQATALRPTALLYREGTGGGLSRATAAQLRYGEGGGLELSAAAAGLFEHTGPQRLVVLLWPTPDPPALDGASAADAQARVRGEGRLWIIDVDYRGGKL
ncbi:MAG: hypothetical protein U1E65_03230 [Myxococcota bacterium]